jgi:hypothetical protein
MAIRASVFVLLVSVCVAQDTKRMEQLEAKILRMQGEITALKSQVANYPAQPSANYAPHAPVPAPAPSVENSGRKLQQSSPVTGCTPTTDVCLSLAGQDVRRGGRLNS